MLLGNSPPTPLSLHHPQKQLRLNGHICKNTVKGVWSESTMSRIFALHSRFRFDSQNCQDDP